MNQVIRRHNGSLVDDGVIRSSVATHPSNANIHLRNGIKT